MAALIKKNPAYKYCRDVVGGKIPAGKYIRLQCADLLSIFDGKDKQFCVNEDRLHKMEKLLSVIMMPKGFRAGEPMSECLAGFQWTIIVSSLCVVFKKDKDKRRYQSVVMELARKSGKTQIVALILLLAMLTEPQYSKMYSCAPDGAISREVKSAVEEFIGASPALNGKIKGTRKDKFRITRDVVESAITNNSYYPLAYSNNRMDSRLPALFVVDEVGALRDNYPIQAMRSGQLTIKNKIGFLISTKYPTTVNPLEEEVAYAKKCLDGVTADATYLSFLYEPDEEIKGEWADNDLVLQQSNPLALVIPEIWEDLILKRNQALESPARLENFLCKHCNIVHTGADSESYVDIADVQAGLVEEIDWTGREVFVGVDLSATQDLTAVSMLAYDDYSESILCHAVAFIPADRIEEASKRDKTDYKLLAAQGCVIPCGDAVIDYDTVERYILNLEEKFGVTVNSIGYDRWNAISSARRLEKDGGYATVEVKQHSSVLSLPTKTLSEYIARHAFKYVENPILEICFTNAKVTLDTNGNKYVSKKRSGGVGYGGSRIDVVSATLDAMHLLYQTIVLDQTLDWTIISI